MSMLHRRYGSRVVLVGFILLLISCSESDRDVARMIISAHKCFGQYPNFQVGADGSSMSFDLPTVGVCTFGVSSDGYSPGGEVVSVGTQNPVRYTRRWTTGESMTLISIGYLYKKHHIATLDCSLPRSLSEAKRREIEKATESCLVGYVRELERE